MGIHINLDIKFNKISEELWNNTFKEICEFVEKTPLGYIGAYNYSEYTGYIYKKSTPIEYEKKCPRKEDETEKFEYKCLRMSADLDRATHCEEFELISHKDAYNYNGEDLERSLRIWKGKTQRYSFHKYILATGLLLEHKLGDAASISGDITEDEIDEAKLIIEKLLGIKVSSPKANIDFNSVDQIFGLMALLGASVGDKIVEKEDCLDLASHLMRYLFEDDNDISEKGQSNESLKKYISDKANEFNFIWEKNIFEKIFKENNRNILLVYGAVLSLENKNRDVYEYSARFFKDVTVYEGVVELLSKYN